MTTTTHRRVMTTMLLTIFVSCPGFSQQSRPKYGNAAAAKQSLTSDAGKTSLDSNPLIIDFSKIDLKKLEDTPPDLVADTGPGTSGGGNSCALVIRESTSVLLDRLSLVEGLQNDPTAMSSIENAIAKARFLLGANLKINGKTVDAINTPSEHTVVIDRNFCSKLTTVSAKSVSLLFHEYLGLAQINDSQYQISGPFLKVLGDTDLNIAFNLKRYSSDPLNLKPYTDLYGSYVDLPHEIKVPKGAQGIALQNGLPVAQIDYSKPVCYLTFYRAMDEDWVLKATRFQITKTVQLRDLTHSDCTPSPQALAAGNKVCNTNDPENVYSYYYMVGMVTGNSSLVNNIECGERAIDFTGSDEPSDAQIEQVLSAGYVKAALEINGFKVTLPTNSPAPRQPVSPNPVAPISPWKDFSASRHETISFCAYRPGCALGQKTAFSQDDQNALLYQVQNDAILKCAQSGAGNCTVVSSQIDNCNYHDNYTESTNTYCDASATARGK